MFCSNKSKKSCRSYQNNIDTNLIYLLIKLKAVSNQMQLEINHLTYDVKINKCYLVNSLKMRAYTLILCFERINAS